MKKTALKEELLMRKGFKCSKCGTQKDLTIHHIKKISKHPELEFDEDNVMVLCRKCHTKIHDERNKH